MLRRFKGKFSKPAASPAQARAAPGGSTKKDEVLPERLGLFVVAESKCPSQESEAYPVDIVAIHGLNGSAYSTWTHANGTMWLRDLLPVSLPGSRIFTYGYPSGLFLNSSYAEVGDFARRLIAELKNARAGEQETRPIIFLCHSLGGIVCKQALVTAHQDSKLYGGLLQMVAGVVFLGTPHRGRGGASFGATMGRLLSTLSLRQDLIKGDLLDHLATQGPLQELGHAVLDRLKELEVVSFYETEPLDVGPMKVLVVHRESAILGIPQEEVIPMYADHREICRFPKETKEYKMVSQALRRIANKATKIDQTTKSANQGTPNQSFDEVDKACMSLFGAFDAREYMGSLPKPIEGTCQWIRNHASFSSWIEKRHHAILWVIGDPGSGKTMHSTYITKYLGSAQAMPAHNTLVYFCDDKLNKQKDAKGALMGLIYQLVDRHRSMIRHVRKVFDLQGHSMVQSFASLWGIFTNIIGDIQAGPICVIIDGLDECEKTSCARLLEAIYETVTEQDGVINESPVKFLLTSRPGLEQPGIAPEGRCDVIRISVNETGYVKELETFIEKRVGHICNKRGLSPANREMLLTSLVDKADQTFLWIHLVLARLEESPLASIKAYHEIIEKIPPGLEAQYLGFLSRIPPAHHDVAAQLLRLIVASSRPLSVKELNIAFTINEFHTCSEEVDRDCQPSLDHTIEKVLGPMARISQSKVTLAHQSVKDFLLQDQTIRNVIPALGDVSRASLALPLASACINYLLLDDFEHSLFFPASSNSSLFQEPTSSDEASLTDDMGFFLFENGDEKNDHLDEVWETWSPTINDAERCKALAAENPFYGYASLHWAEHFAACESIIPAELKKGVMRLLDGKLKLSRNWLHFYVADATHATDDPPNSLHPAVLAGYFGLEGILLEVLDQEPSQAAKDRALFWSCRNGHAKLVTLLLKAGACQNTAQVDLQTPLTIAAKHGHLDCVRALLGDETTDRSLRGRNGRDALSFACGHGHLGIVKELLRQKDIRADEPDRSGATPLFYAAGGEQLPIVTYLLKFANVNVNHQDGNGLTTVAWLAREGMVEALAHFVKAGKGVDINIVDNTRRSPISWAAGEGHTDVVDFLAQHKRIDKASVDRDGRGPISWACKGGHTNALRILLKHDFPGVDQVDIDNWKPLMWAIETNSPEVISVLASHGAELDRRDGKGKTALYWAVAYGHLGIVKRLLEEGADPRIADKYGLVPAAVARNYLPTAQLIMEEMLRYLEEYEARFNA